LAAERRRQARELTEAREPTSLDPCAGSYRYFEVEEERKGAGGEVTEMVRGVMVGSFAGSEH
jgi:hypothetical protein